MKVGEGGGEEVTDVATVTTAEISMYIYIYVEKNNCSVIDK